MSKQALLIFTKNAEAGKVKTRIAATLGKEAALAIYRQLQEHTASATNNLPVDRFVFYSNQVEKNDIWHHRKYFKELQQGNDLGARMKNAFASVFKKGYDRVVIIGTDCPELNAGMIMNAFTFLELQDVVIGPAEDGGYYLLGMKQFFPELFENINWSTATVLDETRGKCAASRLSYCLLPVLNDIDEEKDWKAFKWQHL